MSNQWHLLRKRCVELKQLGRLDGSCAGTKDSVRTLVEEVERRLMTREADTKTNINDLPSELIFNEILANNSVRDILSFCSTNGRLKGLCSEQNVWIGLMRGYSYLNLQNALKEWAWTGYFIDTLLRLIEKLYDRVELHTMQIVYLYLLEQEKESEAKSIVHLVDLYFQNDLNALIETVNDAGASKSIGGTIKNLFPPYRSLFPPIKAFVESLRSAKTSTERLETTKQFVLLLGNIMSLEIEYFSDLLVNALADDEIRFIMNASYHNDVIKMVKYYRLNDEYVVYDYLTYLYGAIVRTKKIDILDPLFTDQWFETNVYGKIFRLEISDLYFYVNMAQEKRIVDRIAEMIDNARRNRRIPEFNDRVIANREVLLERLANYRERGSQYHNDLLVAYSITNPIEITTALIPLIKVNPKLNQMVHELIYNAQAVGYNKWATELLKSVEG